MKFIKIAILTLFSATLLSSCEPESDPVFEDGTGVVNFGKTSITVKENGSMFTIPLELTGEPGGYPVTVKIGVTSDATDLNKVLLITSTTIKITDARNSFVQLKPVWNPESDETYDITLTIESANGAKIGTTSTCAVRVENVVAVRYGQYEFVGNGESTPKNWTLILREGADGTYIMENMLDMADTPKMVGEYDEVSKTLVFNGRVNGKGDTSYFNDINWKSNGDQSLVFFGGGNDGSEPIVFTVNDQMELARTNSYFAFTDLRWHYETIIVDGKPVTTIIVDSQTNLGLFDGGTVEYVGDAITEEWPF